MSFALHEPQKISSFLLLRGWSPTVGIKLINWHQLSGGDEMTAENSSNYLGKVCVHVCVVCV